MGVSGEAKGARILDALPPAGAGAGQRREALSGDDALTPDVELQRLVCQS